MYNVVLSCSKLLGIFSRSEHGSNEVRVNYYTKGRLKFLFYRECECSITSDRYTIEKFNMSF